MIGGPRDDATLAATGAGPLREGGVFAGRYVLERELGRGGMGRVYAALDRTLGERVALELLTVPEGNVSALERFRREVKLARKVTHRNAARTFDIGEHDGILELRAAVWTRDTDRLQRVTAQLARFTVASAGSVHLLAAMYRGELEGSAIEADFAARDDDNPRFMALLFQMMCEAAAYDGRADEAVHSLERSNANKLVDLDLEWLERSPTLAPLRARQDFAALVDAVARRAQSVWVR